MKKCSSCTKDLPDAALHCVFCGAKQPPAPATGPSAAKTVMGHASSEMIEQLKAQHAAAQARQPAAPPQAVHYPAPGPAPGPAQPAAPRPQPSQPMQAPRPHSPSQPMQAPRPHSPSGPPPGAHGVPSAGSVAPTMFVPNAGPPNQGFQPAPGHGPGGPPGGPPGHGPGPMGHGPGPMGGPPMGGPPMGHGPGPGGPPMGHGPGPGGPPMGHGPGPMGPGPGPGPMGPGPMGPGPMGPGPMGPGPMGPGPMGPGPGPMMGGPARQGGYMGRPARGARPIEPWKDSLRLHMFIWGAVLLVAFLTPTALDPDLAFQWNIIIDGDGKAKIEPLLIAAAGLLSILLAFIPTSPPPRGLLAGFLGFTGIVLPTLLRLSEGDFNLARILLIVNLLGMITLVPGLLIREEYRESMLARVMVTIGALCVLAMYLVPIDGNIGIVGVFERIIDAPGKAKVDAILALLPLLYAAMSLLAWLPAPSSGLGKVSAWLWITYWPLTLLVKLIVAGDIGASIKASPYGALMAWAPVSAYFVLLGYGLATVIGKQLE